MTAYDMYDTETGNLWASFPTQEEALAEVRRAIATGGEEAVAAWALGRSDQERDKRCTADEHRLVPVTHGGQEPAVRSNSA